MRIAVVPAAILATLCCCSRGPETVAGRKHLDPQRVRDSLSSIAIPDVRLKCVSPADAITFWSIATQENNPQLRGVSLVFNGDTRTNVTVEVVTNLISSLDLLNDICRQADLVWSLAPSCMVIRPANQASTGPEPVKGDAPW